MFFLHLATYKIPIIQTVSITTINTTGVNISVSVVVVTGVDRVALVVTLTVGATVAFVGMTNCTDVDAIAVTVDRVAMTVGTTVALVGMTNCNDVDAVSGK